MMQYTLRLILCLLAGHVFMAIRANPSNDDCEPEEFAKCTKVFQDVFKNSDENKNLVNVYCDAYKETGLQCLTSNPKCVGKHIDVLRYMTLQHMILDSKMGICTKSDLSSLRNIVDAIDKYRIKIAGLKDIDADTFAPCTAKKNLYCASRLAEEIRNGGKICPAILNFYACYDSENKACDDKIYKDYVADVQVARKVLIPFSKKFPKLLSCQSR